MVRLLNGTSFEPGMHGYSSMQLFSQEAKSNMPMARFYVLQLAVLVGVWAWVICINVRSHLKKKKEFLTAEIVSLLTVNCN